MIRLLSIILTVILFPPAVLAVVSNNAVPGDSTYSIKRALENIIVVVASTNPNTKAAFSQTRSNTRYKEFSALIAQGKQTTNVLNELVDQTDLAVSQLSQVTNTKEKEKLIAQLSVSIEKYDQGLKDVSSSNASDTIQEQDSLDSTRLADSSSQNSGGVTESSVSEPEVEPSAMPTPIITAIGRALATAQPTSTIRPTSTPTPTPQNTSRPTASSRPTSTLSPTVSPRPTSTPTPTPNPNIEVEKQRQREIEEARKRLEEIKKQLEEERKRPAASSDRHKDVKKPKEEEKSKAKEEDKDKEKEAEKSSKEEDESDNSDKKNN